MCNAFESFEITLDELWKQRQYAEAVRRIDEELQVIRDQGDWYCWERLIMARYSTMRMMKLDEQAEALLRRSIEEYPAFHFFRALAMYYWQKRHAMKAIELLSEFPMRAGGTADRNSMILLKNLLVRLYVAVGDTHRAIDVLAEVNDLLPAFSPPLGYLFDLDMIQEVLQAGVRSVHIRRYVDRVDEPQFLIQRLPSEAFDKIREWTRQME